MERHNPIDPIDALLGARIRQCREVKQVTLKQLGAFLGVSYQQIQKYETGANRLSVTMLVQIARFLGVSVHDFLDDLTSTDPKTANYNPSESKQLLGAYFSIQDESERRFLRNVVLAYAARDDIL